jgi:hypothetical protein
MNMPVLGNRALPRRIAAGVALIVISSQAVSQGKIDELGRLFTDPEQREKLEAVRHGAYDEAADNEKIVSTVTVNGVMMRRDGESVVWINGKSTLEGELAKGVNVYTRSADRESYTVPIVVDGKLVRIKPGQSWSDGAGTVKDNY